MSDKQQPQENQALQSDDVLAYLDHHPDFLQHHADRFGLKHSAERVVVSLVDRQMLELKDRARQLEARLQQLVRHGEANDVIQMRSHQLSLVLLSATTLDAVALGIKNCFAKDFGLNRMALRLWHPNAEHQDSLYSGRSDIASLTRNLSAPYCGPYVNDEILSWFPAVPVLQSFCQVALRDGVGEAFGILVLASDDPERFTFDMHTHYLAQIGELTSLALLRVLDSARK
jgi:uncharacterized protein YigA (DUF484 family)